MVITRRTDSLITTRLLVNKNEYKHVEDRIKVKTVQIIIAVIYFPFRRRKAH